jgi:hypothetical protein
MGRTFKTRSFSRWMRKTELTDRALWLAVEEISQGLIDADLGGGIVKKRIALGDEAKVAVPERWLLPTRQSLVFCFRFWEEWARQHSDEELEALQGVAKALLERTATELDEAVADGALQEICHAHED